MKRIITCSDGTWNEPGIKDRGIEVKTNVEKIYECIAEKDVNGISQVKFYDKGVGTGKTFDHLWGGITGDGIDKNIMDVYRFICENYEENSELYLFGFSRGAYTARSLAGFIRNCGILKSENIHLIEKAYELYRDRDVSTHPDSHSMLTFKRENCFPERGIKFIGVWDTVGSLGIPLPLFNKSNVKRYQFHDVTLSSQVQYAYHALAIDERRSAFLPTLWTKSKTVIEDSDYQQELEQRWFAGVHSNIGGGYADAGLSDEALRWMIEKANITGLSFIQEKVNKISPNPLGELRNSYSPMYYYSLPVSRAIDINENLSNQTIDPSVAIRYNRDRNYRPKNLKNIKLETFSPQLIDSSVV